MPARTGLRGYRSEWNESDLSGQMDFDGDQLNATLAIDLVTADAMRALAPHMSVFGFRKPREVTGNLEHPKPVVSTTANFIHDDSNQGPAGRSELMLKMLEPA